MIVRLQGGLGNQMFQAAFGFARHDRRAEPLYVHPFHLGEGNHRPYGLGVFSKHWNVLSDTDIAMLRPRHYSEKSFAFDKEAEGQPVGTYFIGNWQSEKYFESHAEDIRTLFTSFTFLNDASEQFYGLIEKAKVSCSIHVRRTDYLNVQHYHGMPDSQWYEGAIDFILSKTSEPVSFFIFSDDPAWCKQNFPSTLQRGDGPKHTFTVVDANGMGSGETGPSTEHEDLFLMARCDHAIIPNSSFGWWGAWLGEGENRIVVAPKNWFTPSGPAGKFDTSDLIPARWVRI